MSCNNRKYMKSISNLLLQSRELGQTIRFEGKNNKY